MPAIYLREDDVRELLDVETAVDPLRTRVLRRRSSADGRDPVAVEDHVPVRVLGTGGIDGGDRTAFEHHGHGVAILAAASRTASRIFS